jgi:hypothetical protein
VNSCSGNPKLFVLVSGENSMYMRMYGSIYVFVSERLYRHTYKNADEKKVEF